MPWQQVVYLSLQHRAGAVLRRMLAESDVQLHQLPGQWLDALLAALQRPGQSRDDILRRSAGLPLGLIAIFLAEPISTRKASLMLSDSRLSHVDTHL